MYRKMQRSESHGAPVEKKTTAIKAVRKYTTVHEYHGPMFCRLYACNNTRSKVTNKKIKSWRLEISMLSYDTKYQLGRLNVAAD